MTDKTKFSDLPKSVQMLFNATFAENKDKETENSNESLLKRQKAIRMVKDSKLYLTEKDVF